MQTVTVDFSCSAFTAPVQPGAVRDASGSGSQHFARRGGQQRPQGAFERLIGGVELHVQVPVVVPPPDIEPDTRTTMPLQRERAAGSGSMRALRKHDSRTTVRQVAKPRGNPRHLAVEVKEQGSSRTARAT